MADHRHKTETLVGGFILIGLFMMGGLILQFGNIGEWIKGKYTISVDFKEASGVIKGSTVRMRGARIGEVGTKPELLDNAKVRVTLAIDDKFSIPDGSVFQIAQASFLGDKEIVITPPEKEAKGVIPADTVLVGGGPSGLEFIQNEAETIVEDARILMQDARTAMIKMDSALDDIRAVSIRLSETVEIVNADILSETNVENLSSAIANFDRATKSLADLGDDAGPTLDEARLAIQEIREATRTAKDTMAKLDPAIAQLEPALAKVPGTLDSIEKTVTEAGEAIASVQKGDGALAALTNDKETKDDTQTFIKNLRKYGILRYKDEETKEPDPRDRFQGRRR
ncbi:MAG: MlaD family protein [Verrucomicrobiaceae bacterium]